MPRPIDDAKDAQLLALLRMNARLPASSLARRLGVSRSALQQRLARLERDGVIAGYTVLLGEKAAPSGILRAHVLIEIDGRQVAAVVTALRGRPEIRQCHTASGPSDLVVMLEARSTEELDETLDWIGRIPGVRRTLTSLLLTTKFDR